MTVTFTRAARNDLTNIRRYIGKDSPQAASRMAVELVAACDRLELFPNVNGRASFPKPAS
jgi:plasmid stabilization system protein ParE